jgi:hypothetical protein
MVDEVQERDLSKELLGFPNILNHKGAIKKAGAEQAVVDKDKLAFVNMPETQTVARLVKAAPAALKFEIRSWIERVCRHLQALCSGMDFRVVSGRSIGHCRAFARAEAHTEQFPI